MTLKSTKLKLLYVTWLLCKQAIIRSVSIMTPVLPTPAVQWTITGWGSCAWPWLMLTCCLADSNSSRNSVIRKENITNSDLSIFVSITSARVTCAHKYTSHHRYCKMDNPHNYTWHVSGCLSTSMLYFVQRGQKNISAYISVWRITSLLACYTTRTHFSVRSIFEARIGCIYLLHWL